MECKTITLQIIRAQELFTPMTIFKSVHMSGPILDNAFEIKRTKNINSGVKIELGQSRWFYGINEIVFFILFYDFN